MKSDSDRAGDRSTRDRWARRAWWGGLAASALLHLLLVWIFGSVPVETSPFALPPVETVPAPEGLEIVEIAPEQPPEPVPEEPRPEPAAPAPEREPVELEVVDVPEVEPGEPLPGVPGVEGPGRPAEPAEGERMSNASRLQLRYGDGRIWFDPRDPSLFGQRLARFARADSAVRAILRDWLDSLALSEEAERRARDWTFERDGKRWGISPEGIHLGDITIPIPFGFAPSGPQRRAFEQAIRDLTEIQLQDLRADIEAVTDERREAMRERSEEEARRRAGDTLRVRGPP